MISGEDLWRWQEQAKQAAIAKAIPPMEVDWLLQEKLGLDRLSLRLGTYRGEIYPQWDWLTLQQLWQRRLQERVPVQYLAEQTPWRHLRLRVGPGVLIPRPETEQIIDIALAQVAVDPTLGQGRWVDLGTGSGAIALGLAQALPHGRIEAVDCSAIALEIARHNATLNHCAQRVTFHQGQWWEPFAGQSEKFAAMVSNPPYIPSSMVDHLEPEVRDHEPRLALDGGEDGLAALRQLVTTAPDYLQPGGLWLVELMAGQAPTVAAMLAAEGNYTRIAIYPDLAGIERFVLAYTKSGQD
ncbi:peptide chain release factor N(5)-glutamine methyltransferase [Spirulina sp. CCNP1310]|uniref:peptide chain release factor N(5)-glutamine methyltransferase n=1 Tax=Spirulina sp. CCNP1310 TaxID=3110249 RepID=UPI002B1F500C|nr:peptide chain release factor N(5)-glutamine methyltransferase [Spirulina sp. CCNP1310]MEA5419566.1 peptide chain release factor N(5)-glutamine methyltransferase [Spirulina sp. CCNP1310]